MKKFIACLLFLASSMTVVADEAKYNPNSKILKIPVIKIGDSYVYDAELLNNDGFFSLLSYSVNATKNTPKPTSSSEGETNTKEGDRKPVIKKALVFF